MNPGKSGEPEGKDRMNRQKRIAAIHDISGFGKCSLTVALPILSAAGTEACALPTAVLSTHTGGLSGYTYRDLTEDLLPFARHWKSLGLHFDALYSGFLGSYEQIDEVREIFRLLGDEDTLLMVDPAMADNGALYRVYSDEMARGMTRLCAEADLIVPNMTEAAMLLGFPYREGPYTPGEIERVLSDLCAMGPRQAVLTGVWFEPSRVGAACYDRETKELHYAFSEKIGGMYHGTGDVFASVLLAGLMRSLPLREAVELAVGFTRDAIERTYRAGTDVRFGVNFEECLPGLIRRLGLL